MTDREKELVGEFTAGLNQVESAILELARTNRTATFGAVFTFANKASRLLNVFLGNENKENENEQ